MLAGMSLGTEIRLVLAGAHCPGSPSSRWCCCRCCTVRCTLWAFWNPFGEVNKMPAALVNLDEGAVNGGKKINASDQVAAALKSSGQLNLTEMSAGDARRGVADGKYYFSITLPEDFSAAVVSRTPPTRIKSVAAVHLQRRQQLPRQRHRAERGREVLAKVGDTIGQQSVDQVLVGLTTAGRASTRRRPARSCSRPTWQQRIRLRSNRFGSKLLADNLATARDGSAQLQAGSAELAGGVGDRATAGNYQSASRVRE